MLVALFALGGTVSIAAAESRHPAGQVRQRIIYRYFVPLIASGALAASALGLLTGQMWGICVPPAFAFLMLMVGVDNARDVVLSRYGKRSFIDIKTPPTSSSK